MAGMGEGAMIELKGVSKRYGRGAVGADDVSLTIEAGQMVALFGPFGSGKTSILHIIGLLLDADAGEVLLDGERISGLGEGAASTVRRERLGFVFQSFGLLPLLTARENVEVSLRLLGMGREASIRVKPYSSAILRYCSMTWPW